VDRLQNILILFVLWGLGLNLFAQPDSAFMDIHKKEINFGTIYQADGKVTLNIPYTNRGKSKLVISKIIANGLKVKEMKKSGIGFKNTGKINLELDPFHYEGIFENKILIFSNAQNSPQEVRFTGRIISGSYASKFNYSIGGMGFRQSQMNFGYIYKGDSIVRYMPVFNLTDEVLKVNIEDCPDYIFVKPLFDSLLSHKSGMLEVSFDTKASNDWDFVIDKVVFSVTGKTDEKGWVTFTSNIREDFSSLSEGELENSPVAEIPVKIYNFDTIQNRKKVKYDYLLINSGSRELCIRALKPTCGCTAVLSNTNILQPGDSTFINLEFNSTGYSGITKQGVSVITNDPDNYKQFLWITGYVQ
jgi:hypothetical protein